MFGFRQAFMFSAALATALLCGCFPTASDDSRQELDLAFGQADTLSDGTTVLRFAGLREDSRCPVGVECFWAGNGRVVIAAGRVAGDGAELELNTTLEPRIADYGGYRINLVELTPYPVFDVAIDTLAYRVLLQITRNG